MKCIVALLLIFLVKFSFGQPPANHAIRLMIVSGKQTPVADATVSLLNATDSSLVKTSISNTNGIAELENLKEGEFIILISHVNFEKKYTGIINPARSNETLTVELQIQTGKLAGVVVETRKPFIERRIDRLIVNVENSIVSAGSSAFEILERSPGISIDQNDNISLKGKSGVIIMVDGKPSALSGADLAAFLRSQPSTAIERIELITNPSARYDAAGNAGIINIIMKKDKRLGTNGSINLVFGQGIYFKNNSGINLNHRNSKINVFGNYNYSHRKALNDLTINRSFFSDNGQKLNGLDLFNHMLYPINSHNGRAGLDYFISKQTILGVLVNGLYYNQDKIVDNTTTVTGLNGVTESGLSTNSFTRDRLKHFGINLNFKHSFDNKGQELTIDLDNASFNKTSRPDFITSYYDVNHNPTGQPYLLNGSMKGLLDIYSIKSDYTLPLKNNSRFEAGFKTSFVNADNDIIFFDHSSGSPQIDAGRTNHFIYEENINAAYVSWNREIKKIAVQIGLRAEQANIKAIQKVSNQSIDSSYLKLFPSAFFTYKMHKDHEFGLSYSRRIQRPTYNQLNPFQSFIDLTSYNSGNPYLRPEFINSFELSYSLMQRISVTLSYSRYKDPIVWIIKPIITPSGAVSLETSENLESADYYGLNISAQQTLTKWWNTVTNFNSYKFNNNGFIGNTNATDGNLAFNLNTNHSFTLPKKWSAELSFFYNSSQQVAYAFSRSSWSLNAGFQKIILNGRATIRMNVSDIFRKQFPRVTSHFINYEQYFTAFRDTRAVNLSIVYRFGKNTVQAARRRPTGVEEEKNRAN